MAREGNHESVKPAFGVDLAIVKRMLLQAMDGVGWENLSPNSIQNRDSRAGGITVIAPSVCAFFGTR
jgi:hypothetical protein